MSDKINFTASFGDVKKNVELSKPAGGGDPGWHVYIDRYYCGVLLKRDGKWLWHHNNPDDLTTDDINILTEMIEAYKKPL